VIRWLGLRVSGEPCSALKSPPFKTPLFGRAYHIGTPLGCLVRAVWTDRFTESLVPLRIWRPSLLLGHRASPGAKTPGCRWYTIPDVLGGVAEVPWPSARRRPWLWRKAGTVLAFHTLSMG